MPPLRSARLFLIGALALALFSAVRAPLAAAAGTFISAPSRVDMVYDGVRDLLYITNGSQVLRYHLGSASFLAPLQLSGSLRGIDLSPDGNVLAIADGQRTGYGGVDHCPAAKGFGLDPVFGRTPFQHLVEQGFHAGIARE